MRLRRFESRVVLPVASLILNVSAGVFGSVGSALAVASTSRNLGLSDTAEMVLITAPAALAGLVAVAGTLAGLVGIFRKDAAVTHRLVAGLGLFLGIGVALAALGWVAFIGGLGALSMFAWH